MAETADEGSPGEVVFLALNLIGYAVPFINPGMMIGLEVELLEIQVPPSSVEYS